MTAGGRPLRFIATILGGWVVVRAAMLWPDASLDPIGARHARGQPSARVARTVAPATWPTNSGPTDSGPTGPAQRPHAVAPTVALAAPRGDAGRAALAMLALSRFGAAQPLAISSVGAPMAESAVFPAIRPQRPATASRWSASLWFLARGGAGLGSPYGGQLGGDQAGLRLAYAIGTSRRVALVGRIASPLKGAGREGAIGVEWQPTRLPVRLVAEHRFAIDGGGGGPSVGIVGGMGPAPIGSGFRIEGYAQAGVIERHGAIGFGDGAVRVTRPLARAGRLTIDLGAGAWGGIQPGAERLDIGPSLGMTIPIAGRSLRLAVDWRERIGGGAAPGSGIALSIGADF